MPRTWIVCVTNASGYVWTAAFDDEGQAARYAAAKFSDGFKVDAWEM
jgi:hypothetical protein